MVIKFLEHCTDEDKKETCSCLSQFFYLTKTLPTDYNVQAEFQEKKVPGLPTPLILATWLKRANQSWRGHAAADMPRLDIQRPAWQGATTAESAFPSQRVPASGGNSTAGRLGYFARHTQPREPANSRARVLLWHQGWAVRISCVREAAQLSLGNSQRGAFGDMHLGSDWGGDMEGGGPGVYTFDVLKKCIKWTSEGSKHFINVITGEHKYILM